jgi:hypothetical protein
LFGVCAVILLLLEGADVAEVRRQVQRRRRWSGGRLHGAVAHGAQRHIPIEGRQCLGLVEEGVVGRRRRLQSHLRQRLMSRRQDDVARTLAPRGRRFGLTRRHHTNQDFKRINSSLVATMLF